MGGRLQQRPWKFNNIMNMLLKSIDLAAIGKIITCMGKKVDPILHGPFTHTHTHTHTHTGGGGL